MTWVFGMPFTPVAKGAQKARSMQTSNATSAWQLRKGFSLRCRMQIMVDGCEGTQPQKYAPVGRGAKNRFHATNDAAACMVAYEGHPHLPWSPPTLGAGAPGIWNCGGCGFARARPADSAREKSCERCQLRLGAAFSWPRRCAWVLKQRSLRYTPEHCLVNGGFP